MSSTRRSEDPRGNRRDHGSALIERVIAAVAVDPSRPVLDHNPFAGPWVEGEPQPRSVDAFPGGHPLPPSLRAWLAYDGGMLARHGWFDEDGRLAPRTLGELAAAEFGEPWGSCFEPFSERFGDCFLLPGGSDSRRILALGPNGERDELGEYPVFALDVDDLPCAMLMYPGFDAYLADTAGILGRAAGGGYDALKNDRRYAHRMRTHARDRLAGAYELICLP
ncbi:hypothetical protein ACIQF6_18735 [Kitasatospora sp. NPDC092948]|uniref:hypothetical protein n=1 Tax=Kitasatospora sp. NPDC092948 TaxID=3364088 RepID=UPI0038022005